MPFFCFAEGEKERFMPCAVAFFCRSRLLHFVFKAAERAEHEVRLDDQGKCVLVFSEKSILVKESTSEWFNINWSSRDR